MLVYGLGVNLPFVAIQRYNRTARHPGAALATAWPERSSDWPAGASCATSAGDERREHAERLTAEEVMDAV